MRSVLPPRKKDWKPGDTQIGVFYRGANGSHIELTVNAATEEEKEAVAKLIAAMSRAMTKDDR